MDVFRKALSQSVAFSREVKQRQEPLEERCRTFKKWNSKIINKALRVEGTPDLRYQDDIPYLFAYYVWLFPCCSDASEIVDLYNESHAAGILFCKYMFFGCQESDEDWESCTIHDLFPAVSELHVEEGPVLEMGIDSLMLLTACLQHFWHLVVDSPNAPALLFLLICRMGEFLVFNIAGPATSEHVELLHDSDRVHRLRKKTVRTFLCALLVMLRSLQIRSNSARVKRASLADEERNMLLRVQCYSEEKRREMGICNEIHQAVTRIKSLRSTHGQGEGVATMQGENLWKFVSSRMPEDAIGLAPRKITDEMQALLRNVCVFQDAAGTYFDQNTCLEECAMVLQTALRYFYISPAVETFKKLSLVCAVQPGQRLTYAFDFVHFDTGQISQTVFLHNPLFKQKMPPQCVADWDPGDVCGPMAAFMSFDPTISIWYEDCEDPLGILSHDRQISRPADHEKHPEEGSAPAAAQGRYAFVLNGLGLFLIDRDTSHVFTTTPSPDDKHHHVLYLLCLFVFLKGGVLDVCKVAVNSFKLCGAVAANA